MNDDLMGFGSPFHVSSSPQQPWGFGRQHRPGSAAEALHHQQQQRQELQRQQYRQREEQRARRQEENRLRSERLRARTMAAAAARLKDYGFHDAAAVSEVLHEHGPENLKACVRALVERARAAKRRAESDGEYEDSGEDSMEEDNTCTLGSSQVVEKQEPLNAARACAVVQGLVRGASTRKDARAIDVAMRATAEIASSAAQEELHWECQEEALRLEQRAVKMVNGVPYGVLAYEEALLRLQMKLDDISPGHGISAEAVGIVRQLRKDVVVAIQGRLERIDIARAWWQDRTNEGAKDVAVAAQPVSVA